MQINNTIEARAQWQLAMERLSKAEYEYNCHRDDVWLPLQEREEWFERLHGLVAPGAGRKSTPDYFRKRDALAEQFHYRVPAEINNEGECLCALFCEAQDTLMAMPAPDVAALRWKLDKLLEIENDDGEGSSSTPGWSGDYVRQTIEDYRRLLPEAD